ncbi:MAG: amino acid ABC transporter permease [Acetobacteraceae bacterium]|nr:amino acid ABC transporter permease [Acetobacteraceae bacterium]
MPHDFGLHDLMFLLRGALWTLALSAIAFAGGGLGGLIVALARSAKARAVRGAALGFVRANQGTPLLIQIFIVFFGANFAGWDISPLLAAAICFSVNGAAFLGETWAGCIAAVPDGQWQAAAALGLRRRATYARVVLPQAARIAVAPTVGFLVHLVKGTSLAALIGFVELSRAGQIVNNNTFAPLLVFGIIGALYFAICWPLSLASGRLERRLGDARRA